jgi:hypothetical protein
MRFVEFLRHSENASSGSALIGAGLAILFAATWWPNAPILTAVALITLGATQLTLARFHGMPAFVPLVVLHAATYFTLYALFVCATLHAVTASTASGMSGWTALDLAASVFPMAIALKRIASSLWQSTLSRR